MFLVSSPWTQPLMHPVRTLLALCRKASYIRDASRVNLAS